LILKNTAKSGFTALSAIMCHPNILDDGINPKVGKNIFGCGTIFDHAAKANQFRYPWAQKFDAVGLLKRIKGRWAGLLLDFTSARNFKQQVDYFSRYGICEMSA